MTDVDLSHVSPDNFSVTALRLKTLSLVRTVVTRDQLAALIRAIRDSRDLRLREAVKIE